MSRVLTDEELAWVIRNRHDDHELLTTSNTFAANHEFFDYAFILYPQWPNTTTDLMHLACYQSGALMDEVEIVEEA